MPNSKNLAGEIFAMFSRQRASPAEGTAALTLAFIVNMVVCGVCKDCAMAIIDEEWDEIASAHTKYFEEEKPRQSH